MKRNDRLTPHEVITMGLREFEQRFGFRPRDAIEKHHFAATGERITPMVYEAIKAGVLGDFDVSHVNMDEERNVSFSTPHAAGEGGESA